MNYRRTLLGCGIGLALAMPAHAEQMICRDAAAVSLYGYPYEEANRRMFADCRAGDLIRVLPQDTTQFCDQTQPVTPGGYGMVSCTLSQPRRYRN